MALIFATDNVSSFGVSSSGELDNYHDEDDVDSNVMRSGGMGIRPAGATPEERIREKAAAGRRMQQQLQRSAANGGGRSAQNNSGKTGQRGGRGRGGRGRGRAGGRQAPLRNSIQVGAMARQTNNTNTSCRLDGTRNSIQIATLSRPSSNLACSSCCRGCLQVG